MTYKIRRSGERKYYDHDWLKTYHTFSFGDYYDPNFMGFRDLRVINDDRVAAGQGFPSHPHRDMEILTIVLEGELAHKDSMGNASAIRPNEIQLMSAGTGIVHSEYNPSTSSLVHLFQIWILPDTKGLTPQYQQTKLPTLQNKWIVIISKAGSEKSLKIHQDVELSFLSLQKGKRAEKKVAAKRYGWLQLLDGAVKMNGEELQAGDGVAIDPNTEIKLEAVSSSRLLFFDLR